MNEFYKKYLVILFLTSLYFSSFAPPAFALKNHSEILSKLRPASGYSVSIFAETLPRARFMVKTSKSDILVSQPSLGQITILFADKNDDGRPDGMATLIKDLRNPFGLQLDGPWLYVAEENRIVRFPFDEKRRKITGLAEVMVNNLPSGGHSTRTIIKGPDGWFYVTIGSSCNVCIERHKWRASMIRFKPKADVEIFATGLRNTVGYDWHPITKELFAVDNGRDWLGDDLPPGEVNKIVRNGFYGWPFFYGQSVKDDEFGGRYRVAKHGKPIDPVHEFVAHVAPLSLRFLRHSQLNEKEAAAALVAQHGSWNRSELSGYRVVRLSWNKTGNIKQTVFLDGFLQAGKKVLGRPVDSLELKNGTVLISDDLNGVIWKVAPDKR